MLAFLVVPIFIDIPWYILAISYFIYLVVPIFIEDSGIKTIHRALLVITFIGVMLWIFNIKIVSVGILALYVISWLVSIEKERRSRDKWDKVNYKKALYKVEQNIERKRQLKEKIDNSNDNKLCKPENIILDAPRLKMCMDTAIGNARNSFPYKDSLARVEFLFQLDTKAQQLKDDSSQLFADIDEEITKLINNG